jgi:hypothetical protein
VGGVEISFTAAPRALDKPKLCSEITTLNWVRVSPTLLLAIRVRDQAPLEAPAGGVPLKTEVTESNINPVGRFCDNCVTVVLVGSVTSNFTDIGTPSVPAISFVFKKAGKLLAPSIVPVNE